MTNHQKTLNIFQFSFNNLRPVFLGIQGTVESVADYNVLMGIVSAVTLVPNTFMSSLIPSTSRVVAQNTKDTFYKVAIYQVVQVSFYYFYYWPRKMNINSKKVFYTCFAPYAIIGIVCYLICYFIPLGSTHVWNILAYGSIFTFLFSFFTYITFTKNDKLFFKSLIPSIRLNKLQQ